MNCFLGLLFDSENGGNNFFRNVTKFLSDYTTSHPRNNSPPVTAVIISNPNTKIEVVFLKLMKRVVEPRRVSNGVEKTFHKDDMYNFRSLPCVIKTITS
jgi:hypothetical protein